MKKFIQTGLLSVALLLVTSTHAKTPLQNAMQTLAQNEKIIAQSNDTAQVSQALSEMSKAAIIAQENKPKYLKKLDSNNQQVIEYNKLFNALKAKIEHAQHLVHEGQLVQAKQSLDQIDDIKKMGHKAFK